MRCLRALAIVSAVFVLAGNARASETDQFMTWNVDIKDSTQLLNDYLNKAAQEYAEKRNRSNVKIKDVNEMTEHFYLYLFEGLQSSRLRKHIWDTPEIDRYPSGDTSFWTFQRSSIYRGLSFPYVMPMARTIRIGDIYLGIDKICHFFGFGRRYFQRYVRLREEGMEDEKAIDTVIKNGLDQESSLVGGLVDGVFSRGDLEANFQGFMMLRDLTRAENPLFVREGKTWKVNRTIDYSKFVTPAFDESYNISYYTYFRWRKVGPLLQERYCSNPEIAEKLHARFAAYTKYPESRFLQYMERRYQETGEEKYKKISLEDLCDRAATKSTDTKNGCRKQACNSTKHSEKRASAGASCCTARKVQ